MSQKEYQRSGREKTKSALEFIRKTCRCADESRTAQLHMQRDFAGAAAWDSEGVNP